MMILIRDVRTDKAILCRNVTKLAVTQEWD